VRNPAVAFGIEFKILDTVSTAIPDGSRSHRYTHVDWSTTVGASFLTCPGAASWLGTNPERPERRQDIVIAKRLSAQLGVGELVLRWHYGLTILVNGEQHMVRTSRVGRGRHWTLNPKEEQVKRAAENTVDCVA